MKKALIHRVLSTGVETEGDFTTEFLAALKYTGKRLTCRLYKMVSGVKTIVYEDTDINSVKISYNGALQKSVMKSIEIEISGLVNLQGVELVDVQLGLSSNNEDYYYISYGSFLISENEQNLDNKTTKISGYDHMVDAMVDYKLTVDYTTVTTNYLYLQATASYLGWTLDTSIPSTGVMALPRSKETYTEKYTVRDVLDDFAEILGGSLVIDNLALRFVAPSASGQIIDEEQAKKIKIKDPFGQVDRVVLARTPQEDNVYYPADGTVNAVIKLADNLLVEGNPDSSGAVDRTPYLEPIYTSCHAWGAFYPFEIESFGYCVFEPGDLITIKIQKDDSTYTEVIGLWQESELEITQGLGEKATADVPPASKTEYSKSTSESKFELDTYLKVDKVEGSINSLAAKVTTNGDDIKSLQTTVEQTADHLQISISEVATNLNNEVATRSKYYRFDADGAVIGEEGSPFANHMTNTGMKVLNNSEETLVADKDGVNAINVTARQFLIVGNKDAGEIQARFEHFEDDDDANQIGCFMID